LVDLYEYYIQEWAGVDQLMDTECGIKIFILMKPTGEKKLLKKYEVQEIILGNIVTKAIGGVTNFLYKT
jgi:hypothetical protein